ncbi:conserved protein of unknown function [Tepidanaerobacter acetatoxydans Re1]|uniref:Uncharacterized protein n=1 Tax=Tepidanaerobacter acetatoxydans (strain DSM 21804 / JCM 16047 / Re1) TaxID=1209989 RepID=F4LVH1_TEPAE|nr:type 4a pilus biogenesis protein PilO [Tepidanaerobacter acetatoxydans]AEE91557.1 hypothetical protein TepRe1_1411 [Tepidanaerobacter acetatoxydans Re1]CCP26276.1 conserved protein of unknown function [Tepidanaerobacter acetatoxydans Re1]
MKVRRSILNRPLTKREHKLVIAFIVCLIFYGLYFIFYPRVIELSNLRKQLLEVSNAKITYKRLYENHNNYKATAVKSNDIIQKVPKDKDVSGFLVDMENWADDKGSTIVSIYSQSTMTENIAETTVNFIPFEIIIKGNYDSLLSFIGQMENYSRILKIEGLKLNTSTDSSVKSQFPWELTIKVNLYYLPSQIKYEH